MFAIAYFRQRQRPGSVLLPALFVVIVITMLLGAILPLTLSGYGLARADRDRSGALAAAEGGLNWEIARINNRVWGQDDSGNTVTTLDTWPTPSSTPPATASTVTLMTDASGNWTQRFLVGTSINPFTTSAGGWFVITAEGQVRAADGHIVRRRVQSGGAGGGPTLFSLFDTAAIFAFSTSTSSSAPAWSMGGSCSVVGGCGSNGLLYGNGGPAITGGPLGLWGSSASVSGVTTTGITTITRPAIFITDTADTAATNFPLTGTGTGAAGVARWAPAGYDASKNCTGPADSYGRIVNSQAQIIDSAGAVYRSVAAKEFVTGGNLVLDSHIKDFNGAYKLRLRPGVYYFSQINLGNSDTVEIANDWYKADGVTRLWDDSHTAINGAATVDDYNSFGNRITLFVDSGGSKTTSGIGSGLYTALQGDDSASNALRYRRPGNFRIYAKNTGTFTVNGSSSSPVEFNCNLLHYNKDTSGNYYGDISLQSGCHLYGGLFGWTVSMGGGAIVQQYGSEVFSDYDTVTVIPSGGGGGGSGSGGSGSGSGGGVAGGFGGWFWTEVAAS